MFRDIGVEVSALGISRTIGAGNFLLDRQDAGIDGQFRHNFPGKARTKVGCKMRDRTEGGGYTDPNGEFQRDVWSVGKDHGAADNQDCEPNEIQEPTERSPGQGKGY